MFFQRIESQNLERPYLLPANGTAAPVEIKYLASAPNTKFLGIIKYLFTIKYIKFNYVSFGVGFLISLFFIGLLFSGSMVTFFVSVLTLLTALPDRIFINIFR